MVPSNLAYPPPVAPWGTYVTELGEMTIETFDRLPLVECFVFELYAGRLIRMPGPAGLHASVQGNFFRVLGRSMADDQFRKLLGGCCYNLPLPRDTETLLCCDLSFVQPIRLLNAKKRGDYAILAPDLVVEIASPDDTHAQMEKKARVYMQAGVRLLWIAWPDERIIEVWQPDDDVVTLGVTDTLEGGTVIPDFTAPVSAFFEQ